MKKFHVLYRNYEIKSMVEIGESHPQFYSEEKVIELDNNGDLAEAIVLAEDVEEAAEKAAEILEYYLVERD